MAETWYPAAVRLPITTQEFTRPRVLPVISIVKHVTAGTDSRDWLQHADNNSSVTFLIRIENGHAVVYQFMPIEWAAWGNGRYSNNNPYMPRWIRDIIQQGPTDRERSAKILSSTISIEHEGVTPTAALYTGPMLEASIALDKWLMSVTPTIKADRDHIIGHYQIDNVNRAFCPGGPGGKLFPFDYVITALNYDDPIVFHDALHPIVVPEFKALYRAEPKALQYWGYPITQEQQAVLADGSTYTIQYFERARFELHGTSVQLGLIGAELLAKK